MIDLKQMLAAGVHFGHKTSRWSPKMKPYIWGAKNHVHLIDVSKTAYLLEHAGKFLKDVAGTGGKFLFVGTKKPAQAIIQKVATSVKMPYVIHRWVGGTLSNNDQVKKAVTRLLHMRDILKKSTTHYKKKELSMIQKEIARLEKNVGGIIDFEYPPAGLIVIDAKKESSAIKEARRLGIPVIGLVDTNTDPEGVTFIIPTNDDSPKAISFIMDHIEQYVKEGTAAYAATKAQEAAARAKAQAAKAETKKEAAPVKEKEVEKKEAEKVAAPKETEAEKAPAKKAAPKKAEGEEEKKPAKKAPTAEKIEKKAKDA